MSEGEGADRRWVDANRAVVAQAYAGFMAVGTWPKITDLRRHFMRLGQDLDIEAIARQKPPQPRDALEMLMADSQTLELGLRQLRFLPEAHQLVWTCVTATRRAVEVYLSAEEALKIRSDDRTSRCRPDAT